ncbi:hypothetical protein E6C50_03805 [Flavobacterium supellecticarium]|uniref:Peptidase S74 domain-containing protein n=1 Tax=Flavobacterium supellecticarium TaxID=2565924 RepID=A0A4S4A4F8_9FLAO|nr:hypothetical protein [Flavobacterium supellecticarium]THF53337.1 hypothetical protein E6C50_03805 [Flavobacterium supellecticarium]
MRKKLLSILFVLGAFEMYGQVGVGTELPDITSQLDVVANNKGILIPRVSLIDSKSKDPIVNDGTLPNGLIVFNIATSGQIPDNVSPGLYYWLNGSWNRMISPVDIRTSEGTVLYNPEVVALSYIDQQGDSRIINIDSLVKSNETITTLVKNQDGSYTYTNEAGQSKRIDFTGDAVVEQFDHEVVLEKIEALIKQKETQTSLVYDPLTHVLTYKAEDGNTTTINLSELLNNGSETLTALSYDATAHTITYRAEDGNTTTINLSELLNNGSETLTALSYDATAHTITYRAEDGNTTSIDLNALANNPETLTALSYDASTHTITYRAEDGANTFIDLNALANNPETLTALSYDANTYTITYKAEDGTNTYIDLNTLANNPETITRLSYDANTFILNYNAEDGTTTEVDLSDLVNGPETLTALVYDEERKDLIYIDEQGTRNRVNLPVFQKNTEDATSPWYVDGGTVSATSNTENIYHTGNVGIGRQPAPDTALSVNGSVKINPENEERKVSVNIGDGNTATGANALVSGKHNETHGENTAIVGGTGNTITEQGEFGVIIGGETNRIVARNGTIVGSKESVASGQYSVVLGGSDNMAPSVHEIVLGNRAKLYSPDGGSNVWDRNDRIFTVANGDNNGRSNALTVLKNGNTGFKSAASQPTETIDVGEGKVRIRQIQGEDGSDDDRLVVADADGVLRTIDRRDLQLNRNSDAQIEPWLVVGSNQKARWNGQNIYQAGGVSIGHARGSLPWADRLRLNVYGAVRGGKEISEGEIGAFSAAFGFRNKAQGAYAFVTGRDNTTQPSAELATIDGGHHNFIADGTDTSGIFSGRHNTISATYGGVILGGEKNTVQSPFGVVVGGKSNSVLGSNERGVVVGGLQNTALGINTVVLAGENNAAYGNHSFVFGGKFNAAEGEKGCVIGGEFNRVGYRSVYSGIICGQSNEIVDSQNGFVLGGDTNHIINSTESIILGGYGNYILGEGTNISYSAIIGGRENKVKRKNCAVIGGIANHAMGEFSMVLGGASSTAKSFHEVVIGPYGDMYDGNSPTEWDENDRLLVVANGTANENRSNAITVLKNGNTGFKKQAVVPTETIDVGSGNVRIRDINGTMGALEDKVVVADRNGVLKTISRSEFKAPGSNVIFSDGLMGLAVRPEETLDVGTGNVRIRDINATEGNKYEDRIVVASSTGVLKTISTGELIELIPVSGFVATQIGEQRRQIELQNTVISTLQQSLQRMEEKLEALEATVSSAN